jgi:integrase
LRTGEVRRLLRADLDLPGRQVRITQSKGLKDRVVPLALVSVAALQAYLDVRGPAPSDHVFIYRHQPLSPTYCRHRLQTYGRRCGVQVTPHQLRHTAATLLLNAGVPILTVKAVLGHAHIDTTLNYTRLYDGTVAADYYRAMRAIETHLNLTADDMPAVTNIHDPGQLVALVDALHAGTLNPSQRELVQMLREGILALAEKAGVGV